METKYLKAAGAAVSLLIASGPALVSVLWSRVSAETGLAWRGVGSQSRAHGVVVLAAVAVLAGSAPANAIQTDPENPNYPNCLANTTASVTASQAVITPGQSTTLSWQARVPNGCELGWNYQLETRLHGDAFDTVKPVGPSGSMVVGPWGNTSWTLVRIWGPLVTKAVGGTSVLVTLPILAGRPTVTISSNDQKGLFLQAIGTPNALIRIQNHVELDLSNRASLHFEPGVHIIGGRTSKVPGPRLFTRTFPQVLFSIGAYNPDDNVRISGVRLQGGEMGIADGDAGTSVGIQIESSLNVEIDNNEISGWRGAGVKVGDPRRVINRDNYNDVHIHDNFIHHNRHYGREGYGVTMGDTAYALIEKNVFDYNRHAIASGGEAGTGYYAHRNLVLSGGGENSGWAGTYSHQFDVHGTTERCWYFNPLLPFPIPFHLYCGQAGEYFEYRDNTILYTNGTGIKVRGRPTQGADVIGNVFAHDTVWGGWVERGAIVQTDGDNLYVRDNTFGLNLLHVGANECDFDGDGALDRFMATGATWWYASRGGLWSPYQWVYLNTSTKRLGPQVWDGSTWGDPAPGTGDLTFRDVNNDGRCDVIDNDGVVFLTPAPPGGGGTWSATPTGGTWSASPTPPPAPEPAPLPVVPDVRGDTVTGASSGLTAAGFTKGTVSYVVDITCNDIGLVTSQSPAAGTAAAAGTAVKLWVAKAPSTPCL